MCNTLCAGLLARLEHGCAARVEPDIVVIDLGQQSIDNGQVGSAYRPVLTVGGEGQSTRRLHDHAYAGRDQQLLDRVEVFRTRGPVQQRLGLGLLQLDAAVIGLHSVEVRAVAF